MAAAIDQALHAATARIDPRIHSGARPRQITGIQAASHLGSAKAPDADIEGEGGEGREALDGNIDLDAGSDALGVLGHVGRQLAAALLAGVAPANHHIRPGVAVAGRGDADDISWKK